MAFEWKTEHPAYWDDDKVRIIASAEPGVFDARFSQCEKGDLMPGTWWRVEEDGRTVGYGWLDVVWGDAEITLAADPAAQGRGVGSFILERLEREAKDRGLNRLYNMVRPTHPKKDEVSAWLQKRGFESSEDGTLFSVLR